MIATILIITIAIPMIITIVVNLIIMIVVNLIIMIVALVLVLVLDQQDHVDLLVLPVHLGHLEALAQLDHQVVVNVATK
jgi:hypothetical protein